MNLAQEVAFKYAGINYETTNKKCRIYYKDENADTTLEVEMISPVKAVTLGQEAVFYDGMTVLGGGRIARVFNKDGEEVTYDKKNI